MRNPFKGWSVNWEVLFSAFAVSAAATLGAVVVLGVVLIVAMVAR